MSEQPESELELRRKIAAEASGAEEAPSIFVRAGQFFLVPLGIVTACVAVYLFFTYLVSDARKPQDLVQEMQTGGQASRKFAAHQLVAEIRRQVSTGKPDRSLVDPLLTVLRSPVSQGDPELQQVIILSLGLLGDSKAAGPILEELRRTNDPESMAACLEALGALRAPEAAEPLIKLLDHPSTVVRKYAAFNLAAVAAPEKRGEAPATPSVPAAVPHLRRKLEDEREEVRWNAALGLAVFLQDPSGKKVLLQMLDRAYLERVIRNNPKESEVSWLVAHTMTQTCQAVANLRDPSFGDTLGAVAKNDPDSNVRAAARMAIDMISKK